MKSTLPGDTGRGTEDPLLLKPRLRDVNARIRELEYQLAAQYKQRDIIEEEIARISVAQPPILSFPLEILTNIFKEVVADEYYNPGSNTFPIRNRTNLMLTCNRWREVVANTPTLWRAIYFDVPFYGHDAFQWGRKQDHYIDQHLLRSGETDLHVTINFQQALPGCNYIESRVQNYLNHQSKLDYSSGYERDFRVWSAEVPWKRCPAAEKYENMLRKLLAKLMGVDGIHMARWSSLCLTLPHREESCSILRPLFERTAPRLRYVQLDGYSNKLRLPAYLPGSIYALTFVQQLYVSLFSLDDLPECPNLQSIKISFKFGGAGWKNLHTLSRFQALKKLHIFMGLDSFRSEMAETIQLHSLDHLTFSGLLPPSLIQAFDIQTLSRLTLDDRSFFRPSWDIFPQAKIFKIAEEVLYFDNPKRDNASPRTFLFSLLSQLRLAHSIEIHSDTLSDISQVITSLRAEGRLQKLRSVALCSKGERKKVISIPAGNHIDPSSIFVSDGAGNK